MKKKKIKKKVAGVSQWARAFGVANTKVLGSTPRFMTCATRVTTPCITQPVYRPVITS